MLDVNMGAVRAAANQQESGKLKYEHLNSLASAHENVTDNDTIKTTTHEQVKEIRDFFNAHAKQVASEHGKPWRKKIAGGQLTAGALIGAGVGALVVWAIMYARAKKLAAQAA